jgi:hypothetical protein
VEDAINSNHQVTGRTGKADGASSDAASTADGPAQGNNPLGGDMVTDFKVSAGCQRSKLLIERLEKWRSLVSNFDLWLGIAAPTFLILHLRSVHAFAVDEVELYFDLAAGTGF